MLNISNTMLFDTLKSAMPEGSKFTGILKEKRAVISSIFGEPMVVNGDSMFRSLTLKNINDGAHALLFNLGLYRLICKNGLAIPASIGGVSFRIIHKEIKNTTDFVNNFNEIVAETLSASDNYETVVSDLMENTFTESKAITVVGNMPKINDHVKRRSIDKIVFPEKRRENEQEMNSWTLFNVINEEIRREHGNSFKSYDLNKDLLENIQLLAA
jgi:hypothetical protein